MEILLLILAILFITGLLAILRFLPMVLGAYAGWKVGDRVVDRMNKSRKKQ